MVEILTMLKVCLAILVFFVAGGFSFPLNHEERIPSNNSNLFEGDIMLRPKTRLSHVDRSKYWPGAIMYYTIDPGFTSYERGVIQSAIDDIEKYSCVRIKPRTTEWNYVKIENIPENGCSSFVGMQGGAQELNLNQKTCFFPESAKGYVIHEMLHALGFFHQHVADNRDDYVTVNTDNIEKGFMSEFNKLPLSKASDFGFEYDLNSIMHYEKDAFAIDRSQPTIIPKNDPNIPIGQRYGLSIGDIAKLKHAYRC